MELGFFFRIGSRQAEAWFVKVFAKLRLVVIVRDGCRKAYPSDTAIRIDGGGLQSADIEMGSPRTRRIVHAEHRLGS